MRTIADHFKSLRDLYVLYEAADYDGKITYSTLIKLKIEEIKLDGATEYMNDFFDRRKLVTIQP